MQREKRPAKSLKKIDNKTPKVNPVFSRYKFNNIIQGEKTIEQFITCVRIKADECDFGGLKSDLIRDRIVIGVTSQGNEKYLNRARSVMSLPGISADIRELFN